MLFVNIFNSMCCPFYAKIIFVFLNTNYFITEATAAIIQITITPLLKTLITFSNFLFPFSALSISSENKAAATPMMTGNKYILSLIHI